MASQGTNGLEKVSELLTRAPSTPAPPPRMLVHTGTRCPVAFPRRHNPALCGQGESSLPVLICPKGCYYTFQIPASLRRKGGRVWARAFLLLCTFPSIPPCTCTCVCSQRAGVMGPFTLALLTTPTLLWGACAARLAPSVHWSKLRMTTQCEQLYTLPASQLHLLKTVVFKCFCFTGPNPLKTKSAHQSCVWWCTLVIPALRRPESSRTVTE